MNQMCATSPKVLTRNSEEPKTPTIPPPDRTVPIEPQSPPFTRPGTPSGPGEPCYPEEPIKTCVR